MNETQEKKNDFITKIIDALSKCYSKESGTSLMVKKSLRKLSKAELNGLYCMIVSSK